MAGHSRPTGAAKRTHRLIDHEGERLIGGAELVRLRAEWHKRYHFFMDGDEVGQVLPRARRTRVMLAHNAAMLVAFVHRRDEALSPRDARPGLTAQTAARYFQALRRGLEEGSRRIFSEVPGTKGLFQFDPRVPWGVLEPLHRGGAGLLNVGPSTAYERVTGFALADIDLETEVRIIELSMEVQGLRGVREFAFVPDPSGIESGHPFIGLGAVQPGRYTACFDIPRFVFWRDWDPALDRHVGLEQICEGLRDSALGSADSKREELMRSLAELERSPLEERSAMVHMILHGRGPIARRTRIHPHSSVR
jgi:hypothetical protein